jgi:hypothetical protein
VAVGGEIHPITVIQAMPLKSRRTPVRRSPKIFDLFFTD